MTGIDKHSVAIGIGLIFIGTGTMIGSMQIEIYDPNEVGARLFPTMIATFLMGLGLLKTIVGFKNSDNVWSSSWVSLPPQFHQILQMTVLSLSYVWAIGAIGYLLATAVIAPLAFALFGERRPLRLLLVAIIAPAIYHLIFFEGLGVFPPQGEYIDLLNLFRGY